jgi:hypothetical protein
MINVVKTNNVVATSDRLRWLGRREPLFNTSIHPFAALGIHPVIGATAGSIRANDVSIYLSPKPACRNIGVSVPSLDLT